MCHLSSLKDTLFMVVMATAVPKGNQYNEVNYCGLYQCQMCNKFWKSTRIKLDPITLEFNDKQRCRRCHNFYKPYKVELFKCKRCGKVLKKCQCESTVNSAISSDGKPNYKKHANTTFGESENSHGSQHFEKCFNQTTKSFEMKQDLNPSSSTNSKKRKTGGLASIPIIPSSHREKNGTVNNEEKVEDMSEELYDETEESEEDESEESEEEVDFIEEDDFDLMYKV
uniref:Zinc-binding domain-containing protein n=1 Tax=Biomphalaria glabrata TaxID=6526 RepID=A0A2C9LVP6_BIOGL